MNFAPLLKDTTRKSRTIGPKTHITPLMNPNVSTMDHYTQKNKGKYKESQEQSSGDRMNKPKITLLQQKAEQPQASKNRQKYTKIEMTIKQETEISNTNDQHRIDGI